MIRMKVTGMTCGHCEKAVADALGAVPGVIEVLKVSRESEEALIEGEAPATALIKAIEEEGYAAEVM